MGIRDLDLGPCEAMTANIFYLGTTVTMGGVMGKDYIPENMSFTMI